MKNRELLFSLTKKDFRVDTFRSGGKGGQHQNTTNSGCRIVHIESGAIGEARDGRSFHQNKKKALERLLQTDKFKKWHKIKCAQLLNVRTEAKKSIEETLDKKNFKFEVKKNKKWTEIQESELKNEEG